jgi:hypothetical protein
MDWFFMEMLQETHDLHGKNMGKTMVSGSDLPASQSIDPSM